MVAALVGAAADRLVIQRFFWAPRLVLTVATIGLAQILSGIEMTLPSMFGGGGPLGGLSGGFKTPLDMKFSVAPLLFNGAHVQVLIVVPVVMLAMTLFLRRSAVGVGIRASAANAERAMLLGIPVRRLSTVVWSVAAVLSALSAMLAAPLIGSGSSFTSGPALLLPALAAAVLARMESLPRAMLAGIGVGVFQQAVFWNFSRSSIVDVGLLGVILVGLLLQRDKLSRSDDALGASWSAAGETPPVPTPARPAARDQVGPPVPLPRRAGRGHRGAELDVAQPDQPAGLGHARLRDRGHLARRADRLGRARSASASSPSPVSAPPSPATSSAGRAPTSSSPWSPDRRPGC